jgi:hypothetical protein
VKKMTKKQLIVSAVVAAILVGLIITVVIHDKHKDSKTDDNITATYPERRQIETTVGNDPEVENDPESSNTGMPSDSTDASKNPTSINTGGGLKSADTTDGNQYQKTYKAAPPETSGYPVPKSHHFFQMEGSLKPSDPHKAELKIYLDFENNFDTQLQELRSIIQPILGSEITNEIVSYMKTKTSRSVGLDKWWETDSKKINVASGYGDYIIEFLSWKK